MDAAELLRALDDEHARGRAVLTEAATIDALEAAQVTVLGRKSAFGQLQRALGTLPESDRRQVGARVNAIRADLVATLEARQEELGAAAEREQLAADRLSSPGSRRPRPRAARGRSDRHHAAGPPSASGVVARAHPRRTRDRRRFHVAGFPCGRW